MGYYDPEDDEIDEQALYDLEGKVEVLEDELNCTKEELDFYQRFFSWMEVSNREFIQAWYALDKMEKA